MINGRMAEWLTASIMLVFAATLAIPGDLVTETQVFAFFARFGISEPLLAFSMGAVGAARMMALYINGSWRRTPWIRMAGALLGAALFAFLSVSFSWPYFSGLRETFPLMPGIFAVLALFDIIAAYRAGYDARRVQPHL
jgi:hypothetical protein